MNMQMVAGDSKCEKEMPTTTSIDSLSDDLLFLILVGFPADYLHDIAMFVCRRWYHIIHSRSFINAHFHHSTYCLIFYYDFYYDSRNVRPIWMMAPSATQGQGLIQTTEFKYKCKKRFLGTCNGLMLELVSKERSTIILRIINPATKKALLLPSCSIPYTYCGIAYAAASMKYKVVISYCTYHPLSRGVAILSVGVDKSWRQVRVDQYLSESDRTLLTYQNPLLTEGFIHWVDKGERVVTLDVETEILTVSQLPSLSDQYDIPKKFYLSTGKSLSVLICRGNWREDSRLLSLWEMNPETKEWMMLLDDIMLGAQQQQERLQQLGIRPSECMTPLGWIKYPEILVLSVIQYRMSSTAISYNLDTREINMTEIPGQMLLIWNYTPAMYKKSLLWLT